MSDPKPSPHQQQISSSPRRPWRLSGISLCLAALASCSTPPVRTPAAQLVPAARTAADPAHNEVPLPAAPGWQASLVVDNGSVGIWTTGTLDVYPQYGCPDIFGLDDRGRCILLSSYSGKWTAHFLIEDGGWLGALSQLDLDPSVPGREIYCGGKRGNLYRIVPLREGGFDVTRIARFPGQEIHTLIGADLLPHSAGNELLVFTGRGETYLVKSDGQSAYPVTQIADLPGRVRQALLLPCPAGARPWIAAVCRTGEVLLLRATGDGRERTSLERRVILGEPMGLGRMALREPTTADGPLVLFVTRDDGLLLRLQGTPDGESWEREAIYAGPQGLRGVATGRFDPDPEVETVAVFGYSTKLQLLSRRPGSPWTARTLFVDRDKGHWLARAELDGRNTTDELIASGYGGRIVLLSRKPGTGLADTCIDPDPPERPRLATADD